jgi:hypothetical protein
MGVSPVLCFLGGQDFGVSAQSNAAHPTRILLELCKVLFMTLFTLVAMLETGNDCECCQNQDYFSLHSGIDEN